MAKRGRKIDLEKSKQIAKDKREFRLAIVQLFYRDCGHEVRIWTRTMADYGQFEVMTKAEFEEFKKWYTKFHYESSVRELHDCDRYEPGDNLDATGASPPPPWRKAPD